MQEVTRAWCASVLGSGCMKSTRQWKVPPVHHPCPYAKHLAASSCEKGGLWRSPIDRCRPQQLGHGLAIFRCTLGPQSLHVHGRTQPVGCPPGINNSAPSAPSAPSWTILDTTTTPC